MNDKADIDYRLTQDCWREPMKWEWFSTSNEKSFVKCRFLALLALRHHVTLNVVVSRESISVAPPEMWIELSHYSYPNTAPCMATGSKKTFNRRFVQIFQKFALTYWFTRWRRHRRSEKIFRLTMSHKWSFVEFIFHVRFHSFVFFFPHVVCCLLFQVKTEEMNMNNFLMM